MWAPLCLSSEENRAVLVSMLQTGPLCKKKTLPTCGDLQINVTFTKRSALFSCMARIVFSNMLLSFLSLDSSRKSQAVL